MLERIKKSGGIFFARSDEPWVLSGAAVHISFVGQDNGSERDRELDGQPVSSINANLTSGLDLGLARRLKENAGRSFIGDSKGGPFELDPGRAAVLLASPNPHGKPNSDVVRPWANGLDVGGRPRLMQIIDFGVAMTESDAAKYEQPFEYVREHVRPGRVGNNRAAYAEKWWIHEEARSGLRSAILGHSRYIATIRHSKHRLFVWLPAETLPDSALVVIAADDDFTLGVLQSQVHELWARRTGTQVREAESGFRYTPTTTFETFPFPRPTDDQRDSIGEAASQLVWLRDG